MAVRQQTDAVTFSSDEHPELAVTATRRQAANEEEGTGDVWAFNPNSITGGTVQGLPVEYLCDTQKVRDETGELIVGLMVQRKLAQDKAQSDFVTAVTEALTS